MWIPLLCYPMQFNREVISGDNDKRKCNTVAFSRWFSLIVYSSLILTGLSDSPHNPQHPDKCSDILLCQSKVYEKSAEKFLFFIHLVQQVEDWSNSYFSYDFPTSWHYSLSTTYSLRNHRSFKIVLLNWPFDFLNSTRVFSSIFSNSHVLKTVLGTPLWQEQVTCWCLPRKGTALQANVPIQDGIGWEVLPHCERYDSSAEPATAHISIGWNGLLISQNFILKNH